MIGELGKVSDPKGLSVLLSWMERQRIIIAVKDRYETVECRYVGGCKVVAACNTDQYIPSELKSRLLVLRLKPLH